MVVVLRLWFAVRLMGRGSVLVVVFRNKVRDFAIGFWGCGR